MGLNTRLLLLTLFIQTLVKTAHGCGGQREPPKHTHSHTEYREEIHHFHHFNDSSIKIKHPDLTTLLNDDMDKASNCGPDGCAYKVSFNQRTGNNEIEADFSQANESETNQDQLQRSVASSDVNIPDSSIPTQVSFDQQTGNIEIETDDSKGTKNGNIQNNPMPESETNQAPIPIQPSIPALPAAYRFTGSKNGIIQNNPMPESETKQASVPIQPSISALRLEFPGTKNGIIQNNPMPESESNQAPIPIQSSIPALQTTLRFSGSKNGIIQTNPMEYGTIPEKETNQAHYEYMNNLPLTILSKYPYLASYHLPSDYQLTHLPIDYNHGIIESNPMAFNGGFS